MSRLAAVLTGRTARNTVGSTGNQLVGLVTGIATFYVLATRLGVAEYGVYAAALALVYLVAPIAEVGCNHLAVRLLARDGRTDQAWHLVIGTHLAFSPVAALALGLLARWLAPDLPGSYLALLAFSELVSVGVIAGAGMLAEASFRAFVGARIRVATSLVRLAALGWFVAVDGSGLEQWIPMAAAANLIGLGYAVMAFGRTFGVPIGWRVVARRDVGEGMGFAANQLASTAQRDADKAILGAYGLETAAGVYAAGFRAVSLVTLPLLGLMGATYGRFFELGARSVRAARAYAVRLTMVAGAVTAVLGLALALAAPVVPRIFGEGFDDAVTVIRWLSVYPLLKALQYFAANALTGAGLHRLRVTAVAVTASLNVALNLVVIPRYSWRGAVATTLVTEILFTIALWLILQRAARRELTTR
jgi:O-antigen/teichoic acid export membrane protein